MFDEIKATGVQFCRKVSALRGGLAIISAMNGRVTIAALLAASAAVAGCEKAPIAWGDPVAVTQPDGARRFVVDSGGHARFTIDSVRPANPPDVPGLCRTSVTMGAGSVHLFAAWWAVRPDSSAGLYVASSADSGKTWPLRLPVDTTDVSSAGCSRPSPALTTVGDDVYVAYSMIAPEGKGVFFAHSMGSMLHAPVPVIYGERLVSTAIAADADRVVVGYEEPNGTHPQVDIALSNTQGHIFEVHTTASRSVDEATRPTVALDGSTIAVSWMEKSVADSSGSRVVRLGHLQQIP
jgi:hypothetical protein